MTDTPNRTPHAPSLEPTILVIVGITGDLAKRYLLPSLYGLFERNLIHDKTEIVGISRRDINLDDIFEELHQGLERDDKKPDPGVIQRMRQHAHSFQLDMDDAAGYTSLLATLNQLEAEQGVCMNRLYYLAIPPDAYGNVITKMGAAGLNASCQHGNAMTRVLVEKPFGNDLASAEELITTTSAAFGEDQVFRIDHYLAKETAQNIAVFRFENPLFESLWNKDHVTKIDIVASEKIGVEGRATFYERQGALRDFIQNHLLQLLAIATMDEPEHFDSAGVHAAKLRLLNSIKPLTAETVVNQAKRGQYAGYRDEVGNPESHVETYASITTTIDSSRWQDIPVTIRTGKALADRRTTITFNFMDNSTGLVANVLQFRIQPDEGIAISLLAKKPGFDQELQPVTMDFSYAQNFDGHHPDAYQRVLLDAIRGDQTLFASSQEVLAAWRVVDAVVQAWQSNGDGLQTYQPGTPIDELRK